MYSLFLDTHDKYVNVVLFNNGKVLSNKLIESNNKHSVITLPAIQDLMEENNLDINNINEIIVVPGPGSFTGERIAVTIAKTMAYSLNIPIKTIDSLLIKAICIDEDKKIVSIEDRNGAFVGEFVNNKPIKDYVYLNKSEYEELVNSKTVYNDVVINYEKIYEYLKDIDSINPHAVKPLYVKGISALND